MFSLEQENMEGLLKDSKGCFTEDRRGLWNSKTKMSPKGWGLSLIQHWEELLNGTISHTRAGEKLVTRGRDN